MVCQRGFLRERRVESAGWMRPVSCWGKFDKGGENQAQPAPPVPGHSSPPLCCIKETAVRSASKVLTQTLVSSKLQFGGAASRHSVFGSRRGRQKKFSVAPLGSWCFVVVRWSKFRAGRTEWSSVGLMWAAEKRFWSGEEEKSGFTTHEPGSRAGHLCRPLTERCPFPLTG